jgi:omega-6 fatty acid desaturase / acyl-lipid omega-6 desaturase (Delta-12 desaturase)
MFAPHHYGQIVWSDIGIVLWLAGLATWIYYKGFAEVGRLYVVPYLWQVYHYLTHLTTTVVRTFCRRVNHWLVLITFLQHTDPLLPHYRPPEFTFPRGALATLDRNLLGDCGSIMGWIGAHATNGISETHVAHHVSSKIPHYNAFVVSSSSAEM